MTTVELPSLNWGNPDAERRALLVHGLGSDAATMWHVGETLATAGWFATAVDQRGHGRAPRTSSYRIDEYAGDLLAVHRHGPWDVVIGHSIAGAALVLASTAEPGFAKRLVLIDPALATTDAQREEIRANQIANHDRNTVEKQRATFPHWHELDLELSVAANRAASRFALERTVLDNPDWDVLDQATALSVPTLVIQGDPTVMARYTDAHAAAIEGANPLVSHVSIAGTGHNVHRDAPAEFARILLGWLTP